MLWLLFLLVLLVPRQLSSSPLGGSLTAQTTSCLALGLERQVFRNSVNPTASSRAARQVVSPLGQTQTDSYCLSSLILLRSVGLASVSMFLVSVYDEDKTSLEPGGPKSQKIDAL